MRKRQMAYGARVPMEPCTIELSCQCPPAKQGDATRVVGEACADAGEVAGDVEFRATLAFSSDGDGSGEGACVDEAVLELPGACGTVCVGFDGEVLDVRVRAQRRMRLTTCRASLRHAFASDEQVLLNGYQSWTDTAERPAWSRMRGLRGVPSRVVEKFTLDGAGDYAFVDYTAKRGRQHGFTYATFRRGDGMVLVASLDESRGFTVIQTDAALGQVELGPECPQRDLQAGEDVLLGRFCIVRGSMRHCYDRWFELSGIEARPVKPLVGYTSWYRHYGDIDAARLSADLQGTAAFMDRRVPFDLSEVQKVFQIDDGYCKVGDWLDVDRLKFPAGLKPLADQARRAGFAPGLWLAPFVCERDSRLFRERPEWLLRDRDGEPVATGSHWSGGFALDTRNVDVRTYVLEVLQTVTREWGFSLLKLDFLYGACMRAHGGANRGELMADAVDLLRCGAGPDTLLLGCGVPLASAFGKFDYCRIGCDVGLDWDDLPHMRMLHRERVSTKNSLGNTYARAPLDGRAFGNDPDVFFLRPDVHLSDAHRDELLFADADLGHVLLTSDNMAEWSDDMRERYLSALRVLVERTRLSGC